MIDTTPFETFPTEVQNWLKKRTLTEEAIDFFGLNWNGYEIVIPIFGSDGSILFNKYRRNPFSKEEGPKYRYDRGAEAALFNADALNTCTCDHPIMVVEGEMDAIAAYCINVTAVSSTGGAGTFKQEWVELLKRFENVTICFDNDPAGVKGAIHLQSLLPHARILTLPKNCGKDLTEYLQTHTKEEFFKLEAKSYQIPAEVEDRNDKKQVAAKLKEFKEAAENLLLLKREMMSQRGSDIRMVDFILEYVNNHYAQYAELAKRLKKPVPVGDNASLAEVKRIPITSFIKFNSAGYAPCIWHHEKTPSMFYNGEHSKFPNMVKCFSCGAFGDVIDVVMQQDGIDFKSAVNKLKGK